MISKSKANELLNSLFGKTSVTQATTIYLGLSETEPNADTGAVGGEPAVSSYKRLLVGGSNATTVDKNAFKTNANEGKISNSEEIQMPTAKEPYGKTMNYFFLSTSGRTGDQAFLWGNLKNEDGTQGIVIGEKTVPVFYAGMLEASIDVPLS